MLGLRPFHQMLVLAAAIGIAATGHAAAQPACPSSEFVLSTQTTSTTSAATLDTTYLQNRLQFDLAAGTLHILYCCSLVPTYMIVRDAYDVTGVAPGTPVSLTVEVPVSGEIYAAAGAAAGETSTPRSITAPITSSIRTVLRRSTMVRESPSAAWFDFH